MAAAVWETLENFGLIGRVSASHSKDIISDYPDHGVCNGQCDK
jgi:hypothetical protein